MGSKRRRPAHRVGAASPGTDHQAASPAATGGTAAGQRGTRHRLGQHRGTAPGQRGTGHQLGQHRHRHRPGGTLAPKKFFENLGARNFCYGGGPWFESARDLTPPPVPARACRPEVRPASPATANRPAGHQASAAHCQAQQAPSTSAARTPSPCNAGAESAEVRKPSIHAGLRPVGSAGSSAGSAESLAPHCPPSAASGRRCGPHHITPYAESCNSLTPGSESPLPTRAQEGPAAVGACQQAGRCNRCALSPRAEFTRVHHARKRSDYRGHGVRITPVRRGAEGPMRYTSSLCRRACRCPW